MKNRILFFMERVILALIGFVLLLFLIGRGLYLFSTPAEDTIPENGIVISGVEMLVPKIACEEMLKGSPLPEDDAILQKVKNSFFFVKIRPGDLYRMTIRGTPSDVQKQLQDDAGKRFCNTTLSLYPIRFWHVRGLYYDTVFE